MQSSIHPKSEVIDVSPELAEALLTLNTHNRQISGSRVDELAEDMKNGRFALTGSGISLSNTNVLLDGQHRLHAVVKSGVTVQMSITIGIDDDAQMYIDSGRTRQFSQQLSLNGTKNSSVVAATTRAIALFLDGDELTRKHKSHAAQEIIYKLYGTDIDHVINAVGVKTKSEIIAALAIARSVHGYKMHVDAFAKKYKELQFSGKGDPVGALYSRAKDRHGDGHDNLLGRTFNALHAFANNVKIERIWSNKEVTKYFRDLAKRPNASDQKK